MGLKSSVGGAGKILKEAFTANSIRHVAVDYIVPLAVAIVTLGFVYANATPGADGKRDLTDFTNNWKAWLFLIGVPLATKVALGLLGPKHSLLRGVLPASQLTAVYVMVAALMYSFNETVGAAIKASPDGMIAKLFFSGINLVDKDKAAAAKSSLAAYSGPAPIASNVASTAPATSALTGANTPTEGDPLSQIAGSLSSVIEMATQPVGGSVPGGTSGIGYGGYATSLQGLSGVGSAGDRVFGQLVAMQP